MIMYLKKAYDKIDRHIYVLYIQGVENPILPFFYFNYTKTNQHKNVWLIKVKPEKEEENYKWKKNRDFFRESIIAELSILT